MDGLLIDSEDMYTLCTNEVLREYGKPDLPWSIKAQLQGRPGPAVCQANPDIPQHSSIKPPLTHEPHATQAGKILFDWAQLPCTHAEFYEKTRALQAKYFPRTQPLPGASALLSTLSQTQTPRVRIALATSSHRANFVIKSRHLDSLFHHFAEENRVLGDDERIGEGRGKPLPDIYLLALETLNEEIRRVGKEEEIRPEECLVLEDSVPGVEAGRRMGAQVVWCPHPELLKEYRGREAEVLAGLTGAHKDESPQKEETKGQGSPGELNDGWAVLLHSLEEFPYERFGINV